jgi:hypothetical protein
MNHLFLIGIDKYKNHKQLNSCVRDLIDFKSVLLEKYDFEQSKIYELYDAEATNKRIQDTFKGYIKSLDENDSLVIYFSGHGGLEKTTDRGFWISQEADSEDYTTWLPNETLHAFIQQIKAKHIFLISDCCFSWSILNTQTSKATADYASFASRIALTSGQNLTYDGSVGENSFFAESILTCLKEATEDLRVGKIIEFVKDRFTHNKLQAPQGAPMIDPNHKNGEFVFKIVNNEIIDDRQIKGYTDFICALNNYKKNGNFELKGEYGLKEGEKAQRIGYQLYQEFDSVQKKATYYLYLFEGINQKQTLDHLKTNNSEIFVAKNLIIFLPKEKHQVDPEKRKKNINDKFKPLNIFYIDEFIRDHCTPKNIGSKADENFLEIPNFIVPSFEMNNQTFDTTDFFSDWLSQENEPIMVLKGEGGIGKTTLAQFIADKFIKINPKSSVLFIDSGEIKTELIKRRRNYQSINVYNFYESLYDLSDSTYEKLSEDLFRINLDAGNFLLIIDGLDEVISKVIDFNVDEFLNSIIESTSQIGNGKIILTCRSYFWAVSKFSSNEIKTVELLPFNQEQTKRFFQKSFINDERKVSKSLRIAEEFKFQDSGEYFFHPYVLDVVRSIIESDQEIIKSDATFESDILEKEVKNDYIIYRICYRERLRVEQIGIDDQVIFFSYWSIKRRGVISMDNFSKELIEAIGKPVNNVSIEAFKSHPFIQIRNKTINFKYDFFADYFKSIYVSRHLKLDNNYSAISEDFLKIISENCWYGSGMINDIRDRLLIWDENNLLQCSDLINQILTDEKIDSLTKRKTISGLLNICLAANIKKNSCNILRNTELLHALFGGGGNEIKGMQIIGIHNSEETIRFDFSNLILKDCYIDGYQSFWNCTFNEQTLFMNCYLLNIDYDSNKKLTIGENNFQNCTTDDKFKWAFKKDSFNAKKSDLQVKEFLEDFFKMFFSKGRLERQGYDFVIKRRFPGISQNYFDFDEVMKYFDKIEFFEYFKEYNEKKIKIKDLYKADVVRFIKDGTMSKTITNAIAQLSSLNRD